jgi:hypothetical protein
MNNSNFNYTIGELAELLKTLPQNLPVVISGYESGFENFYAPYVAELVHKPENMYWDGEFQRVKRNDKNSFKALILERELRND